MTEPNPYAIPKTNENDFANPEGAPALWNPNAAAIWGLLLSPVFTAFIHMLNWQALGQQEKADESRGWMFAGIIFLLLLCSHHYGASCFLPFSLS